MKGMPLPFDFEGKGVLDLDLDLELILKNTAAISSYLLGKNCDSTSICFGEPTSVLDSAKIPSRPASSSTLSSSLGAGGGGGGGGGAASTDTAGVAAVSDTNPSATATSFNAGGADNSDLILPVPPSFEIGTAAEKFAMEDWESVLSEPLAVSPPQEQSILRWIMRDVDDSSSSMANLNKVLQIGTAAAAGGGTTASEFDFAAGFGVVDQLGFGENQFCPNFPNPTFPNRSSTDKINPNPPINPSFNNLWPISLPQTSFPQLSSNPNHALFFPMPFPHHQDHSLHSFPPPAKRHNSGEQFQLQQQQQIPQHHPQAIVEHLYKAAELIQTGNPVLAQGILARLNHQLSPIGKPFNRAAFYCKEALQSLLQSPTSTNPPLSPISLIFKIGAYKSFSEISPLIQFANFTCNQALLEVLEGFDQIHIVDFDIGYGSQWASLMQELSLRTPAPPAIKITAISAPSTHDHLELGLTRENLMQFAAEINVPFEFEVMSIEFLNSGLLPETEAVAVNLPVGCLANYSVPLILSFIKQLSPKIIVSVDRGCDRTDLPFANHIVHTLQSYSNLIESLDAGNMNPDAMQKIERLLIQPGIEKIVLGRFRSAEKMPQHWRALFLSSGFSPVTFSNFAESQAECVVKRVPIRGFQVEKRQSSLVLCWQRKELISASAWRC